MKLRHVISTRQFLDTKMLDSIFTLADEMKRDDETGRLKQTLQGKILASVFYEPSTRTRFSFESAMHKLGGRVISTESASHFSSVTKGETLQDTIKIISSYADVIVLRHYEKGSAQTAAEISHIPIINAGDGPGEHPTQALLDLYTIRNELGKIDGLDIALVGDLLYGRTIHSLLNLLMLYKHVKIHLVAPSELGLPDKYMDDLKARGIEFNKTEDLNEILRQVDVLYMTRIQKERFKSPEEYDRLKDSYVINENVMKKMKKASIVMHPLPRVNEISTAVDSDRRAAYFRQAKNGLYIRMALLQMILDGKLTFTLKQTFQSKAAA